MNLFFHVLIGYCLSYCLHFICPSSRCWLILDIRYYKTHKTHVGMYSLAHDTTSRSLKLLKSMQHLILVSSEFHNFTPWNLKQFLSIFYRSIFRGVWWSNVSCVTAVFTFCKEFPYIQQTVVFALWACFKDINRLISDPIPCIKEVHLRFLAIQY